MKTPKFFNFALIISALIVCSLACVSCVKDEPESTMEQMMDTAPVIKLQTSMSQAKTLADLPAELKSAALTVSAIVDTTELRIFSTIDLNIEVAALLASIQLSADEVTKLQANDPYTYDAVINRMAKPLTFISKAEISRHYDEMKKNSLYSTFMIAVVGTPPADLYASNGYQGVLDLQNYIVQHTIPMLQSITRLKLDAQKSGSLVPQLKSYTLDEKSMICVLLNLTAGALDAFSDVYINSMIASHSGGSTTGH